MHSNATVFFFQRTILHLNNFVQKFLKYFRLNALNCKKTINNVRGVSNFLLQYKKYLCVPFTGSNFQNLRFFPVHAVRRSQNNTCKVYKVGFFSIHYTVQSEFFENVITFFTCVNERSTTNVNIQDLSVERFLLFQNCNCPRKFT